VRRYARPRETSGVRRLLPHTADVAAEIGGADLAEIYREGTALVREILVGESPVEARQTRRIELAGDDDGERLFRYLRELVYLADAESFLAAAVRLAGAEATVEGERFDAARHVAQRQIKALTRHQFALTRDDGGYRCRMVFDL
jgi:SHS2 domain-containing protein